MKEEKKKKKKKFKALRIFGKILLGLFIFIILLLLFIRSPWGQNIIVDKIIASVAEKTGTQVEVEDVYISFTGDINIDGLYIEDLSGDTLLYSRSLEANIPLWPIINGNGISINSVTWKGVTANIVREDSISGFNYEFLVEAYAPADTTATTPADTATTKFSLGNLYFNDFDIDYKDAVAGTYGSVNLENFTLEMQDFDLEKMLFHIGNADLSNAKIRYSQTKPFPEKEEDTIAAPTPLIRIDDLKINDVKANYESVPDGILAKVDLGKFLLKMPKANLATNTIIVENLVLQNSEVLVKVDPAEMQEEEKVISEEEIVGFEWPEWTVSLAEISMENNDITYLSGGAEPEEGIFNPDAIAVSNLNLQLNNAFLKDQSAGIALEKLTFSEASGINLKNLTFQAAIDEENLEVNDLRLHLNESFLKGQLELNYASVEDFIETPENTKVAIQLPEIRIDADDAYIFQPELKNNEIFNALATEDIYGNLSLNGTLADIEIPQVNLNWGATTQITATGSVQNAMEPENIQFNFPQFKFVSRKNDIVKFVEEDSLGVSIPEKVQLAGSFRGNPDNISADASLIIPEGKIFLNGSFKNQEILAFDANLEVEKLNLGELLQNEQLGEISITLTTEGQGASLNSLDAVLASEISNLEYNGYQFENIEIKGELENGTGPVSLEYRDYNLNMEMNTLVQLDTVSPAFDVHLYVIGADLAGLNLSKREIKTQFKLNALYEGNPEGFDVLANITEAVVVYEDQPYLPGDVELTAHIMNDTTSIDINNKILDLELRSNASPAGFATALQDHFRSYISEKEEIQDTIKNPVQLELTATVNEAPIINDVLITNLKRLDTVHIDIDFNEEARKLDAFVSLPFINYNGNEIDSLLVQVNSDKDNFSGGLSFREVNAGPIAINRTNLTGNIANDRLYMNFESYAQDSLLVNVQSTLNAENDSLYFHVDPSELLLNGEKWEIPENNRMVFAKEYLGINDFRLHRNNQELVITSPGQDPEKEKMTINVQNFPLESLIGFLNPEESLATGELNGDFIIEELYGNTGMVANLGISQFHVMDVPLGNLTLEAEALGGRTYNFDLALKGGNINMDLVGNYIADTTAAKLDMNLALHELELEALEEITDGEITEASGNISGNLDIGGTTADLAYEGAFTFNDAEFTIATLNAGFQISGETVEIDTTGLYFDTFKIQDENSSGFVVNGAVLTESFINPAFDLTFEAQDFQLLNSTEEDSDFVYGKAVFDLNGSLSGDLNLPVVDLTLDVHPETNLTYVIPEAEVGIISREGVVIFVNKENPDNILTRGTAEEASVVTGMIVDARINISEGSAFSVIINQETGDNLEVIGEGTLNFSISENGRMNLAGLYELSGGHYEINLYGLVNRKFTIQPESTISWFGDPLDANLDITAVYSVETSASSLMAAQTSGEGAALQGQFRQELPFLVFLNIDGRLMQPKLSFGLGMPEDERGAIGGTVYGRIQQLNEHQNELNKQVFSLLVLNRFYPTSNSYGSEGGTLTLARDNLNQALSDQLNMFSDRILGDTGVQLNFGLDSYTDYQGETPQERTALEISAEKSFFNDKFIVAVGSEVDIQGSDPNKAGNNPLIGNVSLQLLLTEDGRFRLKGFRRNTFENVIDGQVIISGIALIFQKEFNDFKNLWAKQQIELTEEEKAEKERKEQEKEEKKQEENKDNVNNSNN